MRTRKTRRRGYAVMMCLVLLSLLFSLWSVAYRQMGDNVRIEAARSMRALRDQGTYIALARALALLETGDPTTDPFVCQTTVNTFSGDRDYTVIFQTEGDPADRKWSVRAYLRLAG